MKPEERRLSDRLLATRTPQQLADELARIAFQRVRLLDQVGAMKVELFWMRVAERDAPTTNVPAPARGASSE